MDNEYIIEWTFLIVIVLSIFLIIISIWRMKNKNNQTEEDNSKILFRMKIFSYAFLFIIFMMFAFFVCIFNFVPSNANSARYMISAFIQSEAAILAIVITLSLFVVQQSSSSYSPRVVELFKDVKKNPDFYILIGIYLGVMLYSALVLKAINDNLTSADPIYNNPTVIKTIENELFSIEIIKSNMSLVTIQTHIWMTYFLAFFAFVSLVLYIRHTIDLLNPSNIIRMLSEDITPGKLLSGVGFTVEIPNKSIILNLIKSWNFIISFYSKGNPRFDKDNDPIVPLIDIVRGSLMRYDYETASNGLKAIQHKVISIIDEEDFERIIYSEYIPEDLNFEIINGAKNKIDYEKQLIKSMYENVFSHFERTGQLAVVRADYHSAKEIIIILYNFINKIFEKDKVNPQAEYIIEAGISSLEVIGTTASKQKMEIIVIEVSELVRKISKLAVKKELEKIALYACEVETNLMPNFDDAWINKSDVLLHFNNKLKALDAVEQAIEIKPSSEAWMKKSDIYDKLHREKDRSNAQSEALLLQHDEQERDDLYNQY